MERKEAINDIMNDLLMINNDRIAGYEKAKNEIKGLDIDLKGLFDQMITQSVENKEELIKEIEKNGGLVEDDTTAAGKIYRAWMDIKGTMGENDRRSVLASCEFGEDAAQRAYVDALASASLTHERTRNLITTQSESLKRSYELIKQQHNAHKTLQK